MDPISQKLWAEVKQALELKDIRVLASPAKRGKALLSQAITTTQRTDVYTEPYLFVGPSSAKRYEAVEEALFSHNVRDIIERLRDVTVDLRVAIFNAARNNGSSYTLEIVVRYSTNMIGALCFNLELKDSRNWESPEVEAQWKEAHH
ncbi:MAG: hypothetical protein AAB443_01895 [Patescibacteria group bacterium]